MTKQEFQELTQNIVLLDGCHQVGTCSAVQKNNILCQFLKLLFCHMHRGMGAGA